MPAPRIPRSVPKSEPRPNMKRNAAHLAWIRTLPSLASGLKPCVAAHVRVGTDGGMGTKPSDRYTVPLLWNEHQHQHNIGELMFWGGLGIDPTPVAERLYRITGDTEQGIRTIERARQQAKLVLDARGPPISMDEVEAIFERAGASGAVMGMSRSLRKPRT